jgi:hypothetical protein
MAGCAAFIGGLSRRIDVFERKTDNKRLCVTKLYRRFTALAGYFQVIDSHPAQAVPRNRAREPLILNPFPSIMPPGFGEG